MQQTTALDSPRPVIGLRREIGDRAQPGSRGWLHALKRRIDREALAMRKLNEEILALYRDARAGAEHDFRLAAMARARLLLPLSATTWVNGVLSDNGPVILETSSIDLAPGFWKAMEPFMVSGEDPLGPMMYAQPGRSFVTEPDFFPPRMRELAHNAFDVHSAITGLSLDPHTGIFSAVCWHRNVRLPAFTEAERRLHEQLLPHWMEGLAMHRTLSAARVAELAWVPGQNIAVIDHSGTIHHAQLGFGELLKEEFPTWSGAALPQPLMSALRGSGRSFEGLHLRAAWREATGDHMVVALRHSHRPAAAFAHEVQATVLHASLEEVEQQLGSVSGALAEQQRRQAVTEERQRIMRELHDGVGSHLVGLLNLAHSRQLDPQAMEEAVREALDEMRMAVDSMQASDINLPTAVANLRYRLQPRFDTAGIRTLWQIPEESEMPAMATADVFQWQRILLEAFTNVLKHARAGHVVVVITARHEDERTGIVVEIRDDGIGLNVEAPAANQGQGLRNMRHRAHAIGAQLSIEPNPPHGAAVRLSWFAPVAAQSTIDAADRAPGS